MLKNEELSMPNSCINKASDLEMVFVLRAHDPCAAETVRQWVIRRLNTGKNRSSDTQIIEALACADIMEAQRREGF